MTISDGARIGLSINGEVQECDPGTTVAQIVEQLVASERGDGGVGDTLRGFAVACNAVVVPRSAWASTIVEAGDRLEVLRAAQGGC